ncbi:HD domain-containing protein [Kitasatospora sp. RB6PN24]|uniref:HD domain-containing protein n=1 Tax=Kitasatospora humi TaxID=2893891 RepID=UPI001E520312|nr:HD domain-containing protein [Kitasatospora humi]MCC9305820.1 HD domain-containing protein [Kitasatospora humi]
MATISDVLALPTTATAVRALAWVRACEREPVANHSVRSYLFAVLLAEHEGLRRGTDFDPDLLYHACVLHDLGTSAAAPGEQRFEVEGADLAAAFLTEHQYTADQVDAVWEAIALHATPGIAERRGPLSYLTYLGISTDFGFRSEFVSEEQAVAIHAAHPRLNMATALVDDIVRHASRGPLAAPRYSLAAQLVHERAAPGGTTGLESAAAASRWGE